jgi:hypothetical protein
LGSFENLPRLPSRAAKTSDNMDSQRDLTTGAPVAVTIFPDCIKVIAPR